MNAPYTVGRPWLPPTMIIGVSTENVAPDASGSLTPSQRVRPVVWTMVTMPQTSKSAFTSMAMSSLDRPRAPPTIKGTATAPAYMMKRCWTPSVMSLTGGSTSSTGCTDSAGNC